ncbi:uncharacterized protein LOC134671000 [Cydia fagiglandana]|uniref:uncharacterized protein LOC134671000 n=1 Tax=Cydia fagiglandana TaxID=1458189 RepID=UPI002FEE5BBF
MQWNQENVLKFIELYRNKELLWDPKHKLYFNKILKNDAWTEISEQMNCGASVQELKKKMESLLGQLRREKGKTKKSAAEVYKSSWYAYEHMTFLLDRNKPRTHMNTENLEGEDNHDSNMATPASENDVSREETERSILTEKAFSKPIEKAPKRKKYSHDSENEMINSAFKMLSSASAAVNEVSARASASDDSQIYANFIASKMRTYSQRTKNSLQHQISNLLFQADNGYFEYYQDYQGPHGYSSRQSSTPVQSPVTPNEPGPSSSQSILSATSPGIISDENDTQDSFRDLLSI